MSVATRRSGGNSRLLAGVALYLLVMAVWIYARVDTPDANRFDTGEIVLLAAAHVIAGFLIGRWWAPALVLSLLVLGAPAGTQDGEEAPLVLALALYEMPIGALLLLLGVAMRRAVTTNTSAE
jgi:hypothetical protein